MTFRKIGLISICVDSRSRFKKLSKPTIMPSLRSFIKKYQPSRAYIVHLGKAMSMKVGQTEVEFVPWYELLGAVGLKFMMGR
ncbi:hypothetical protein KJ628_05525 [Patescibacteria group bacterium]|nr:hypothetical protein [Patescibacteria group bacterium]